MGSIKTTTLREVAIIGAGLAGVSLALTLTKHSIPCTIYESRSPNSPLEISSGVILTPNGLWVLDHLGVFDRISDRCWKNEYRTYKSDIENDKTIRKTLIADEKRYGYKNHRIWRQLLLDEMKLMLTEQGIEIKYHSKYGGIVSEDEHEGIEFLINDETIRTDMLIGADGIYSSVRRYIAPDIKPEYTGVTGVLTHIPTNSVKWPYENYDRAATIQGKPGAIFYLPETADGSVIMIGKQSRKWPDMSRAEWEALSADKSQLSDFYRENYDEWREGGAARAIIDSVCAHKEKLYLWPFLRMPVMERWYSRMGRVVIVGDAAHAVPPSSGQGVNQALEDVYSLTMLLVEFRRRQQQQNQQRDGQQLETEQQQQQQENGNPPSGRNLTDVLKYWQSIRQKRIDDVYEWATVGSNVQRMSEEDRRKFLSSNNDNDAANKSERAKNPDDMAWLYTPNLEGAVRGWIETTG